MRVTINIERYFDDDAAEPYRARLRWWLPASNWVTDHRLRSINHALAGERLGPYWGEAAAMGAFRHRAEVVVGRTQEETGRRLAEVLETGKAVLREVARLNGAEVEFEVKEEA